MTMAKFSARIVFADAAEYVEFACAGLLQRGQYVHFDGIDARFLDAHSGHVSTLYKGSNYSGKLARKILADRAKLVRDRNERAKRLADWTQVAA